MGLEWQITASLGVACSPESTVDAAELFNLADQAMYESKNHGGNRGTVAESRGHTGEAGLARLTPKQIQNRVDAVDLELSIRQGVSENFVVIVENKSDETVTIKRIKISHKGVKLTETPPPRPEDDWVIPPRLPRQLDWIATNPNPAVKLMSLLGIYSGSPQAILEVEIQAEVLGRLKMCQNRIQVQLDAANKTISRF